MIADSRKVNMINPKSHDALFKWLITAFTDEFFEHYFPDIRIGKYIFIDKEFIKKYESLKESLKGDLFVIMEVEIDGTFYEIVIQIEHQSNRENVSQRVYEYSCYAWLLKQKPVWSIVIYSDNAIWKKDVPNEHWFGFDSIGKQFYRFDVIKVNKEKSVDLIKKQSLLCRLLALKADDRDADLEELIREIYRLAAEMKDQIDHDKLLLIDQWVNFYKKIPKTTVQKIKKEVRMEFVETTISEHIFNQGRIKGKIEGKIEGEIEAFEKLYKQGILTETQFKKRIAPLKRKLDKLTRDQSRITEMGQFVQKNIENDSSKS